MKTVALLMALRRSMDSGLGMPPSRQELDVASFMRLTDMGCEAVIVTLPAVSVGPYELAEAFEIEMSTAAVTSS